jgi:hypothetical protein
MPTPPVPPQDVAPFIALSELCLVIIQTSGCLQNNTLRQGLHKGADMALVRLIYTSKKQPAFSDEMLAQIVNSARIDNREQFITGCLFINRDNILQYLEGGAAQVNRLYNRIVNDERHTEVQLIDYSWISKREFVGWSMGYAPDTAASRSIFVYYAEADNFNPASLSVDAALHLIKDLKDFAQPGNSG